MNSKSEKFKKVKALWEEFLELKKKIFGKNIFVVIELDDPVQIRYSQLLGFFYPCYRTSTYKNPLTEGGI